MKETGIIMSRDHPQLIRDRLKTMTRRTRGLDEINEHPDAWEHIGFDNSGRFSFRFKHGDRILNIRCPYGQVGDLLWVRETHYRYGRWVKNGLTKSGKPAWRFKDTTDEVLYFEDEPKKLHPGCSKEYMNLYRLSDWYKRSPFFLPFRFSRLSLGITGLRAERLHCITEDDAKAEGAPGIATHRPYPRQFRDSYEVIWDLLNAKNGYPYDFNPWVWTLTHKLNK